MSQDLFFSQPVSSWMRQEASNSDIVLSSRIRLARNLTHYLFQLSFLKNKQLKWFEYLSKFFKKREHQSVEFAFTKMNELQPLQKQVLVEKHLISPNLAEGDNNGACFLSEKEDLSIMVNEEDHLRIQCLFPGLQLSEALSTANKVDNWIEKT